MPSSQYVVKSGDSLWTIAQKTGKDWLSLVARYGGSNPNLIRPGEVIGLPSGRASEASRSRAAVRVGISATGRPEDVGAYTLDQGGNLVQSNFTPALAQVSQAPTITGLGTASEIAAEKALRARQPLPSVGTAAEVAMEKGALARQQVARATVRSGAATAHLGVQPGTWGEPGTYLAAPGSPATNVPPGGFGGAGAYITGRGEPTPTISGRAGVGAPTLPQTETGQIGYGATRDAVLQAIGQNATQRTAGTGRSVAGTTPAYWSPDVRQLQEQTWDARIGITALQLLNGQGFPTYTMSRLMDDPRLRNVIIAYFADAGVDVSGLTTLELLDIMGYKRVDGDVWYRSDNGAATGGVGTFGGTTYFGGYSGGGISRRGAGGGGSRGGVGGGGGGGGGYTGLIDWRVSA